MYKRFDDIDVGDDFVLPEGNVVRGQLLFKKHCAQCHTIRRDGTNPYGTLTGPNLYGVMGRTAAVNQRTGWVTHSQNLEDSGILWTERNMMAFLKNPKAFAGGVIKMNFRGMDSFQDRVDLIHYLQKAGHEAWMVQDGTPHSQKNWWTRGAGGATKNYWEVHATDAQLKPWQHLWRAATKKVANLKAQLGLIPESIQDPDGTEASSSRLFDEDDVDAQRWRQVAKVESGVKSASLQRSFNWPPPEVISDGPKRKKPAAEVKATSLKTAEPLQAAPPSLPFQDSFLDGLPPCTRALSGIWVCSDASSVAAVVPPAAPAPAITPPSLPSVTTSSKIAQNEGGPHDDGGTVAPSGLIIYASTE